MPASAQGPPPALLLLGLSHPVCNFLMVFQKKGSNSQELTQCSGRFLLFMRVGTPTVLGLKEKEGAEKNLAFATFSSVPPFP